MATDAEDWQPADFALFAKSAREKREYLMQDALQPTRQVSQLATPAPKADPPSAARLGERLAHGLAA
jgi:hypothetical protein